MGPRLIKIKNNRPDLVYIYLVLHNDNNDTFYKRHQLSPPPDPSFALTDLSVS